MTCKVCEPNLSTCLSHWTVFTTCDSSLALDVCRNMSVLVSFGAEMEHGNKTIF